MTLNKTLMSYMDMIFYVSLLGKVVYTIFLFKLELSMNVLNIEKAEDTHPKIC